jgi:hypothetical protein
MGVLCHVELLELAGELFGHAGDVMGLEDGVAWGGGASRGGGLAL